MVRRLPSFTSKALTIALWGCLGFFAACSNAPAPFAIEVPSGYRELMSGGRLRVRELSADGGAIDLAGERRVLIATGGWRVADRRIGDEAAVSLKRFAEAGGRIVFVGHAAGLVSDLGIEEERPELETFRWGYDSRTSQGRARLGIEVVSGRSPELFEGLQPAEGTEFVHYVAAGAPCSVPLCSWSIGHPQKGVVLGRLAVELDGIPGAEGAPVLVQWQVGKGTVLALGIAPDLESTDPEVRANARRLLRNLLGLAAEGKGDAAMLLFPEEREKAPPVPDADFAEREIPMQPLLAHWGWSVSVSDGGGEPRTVDEITDSALSGSWVAGADLLEVQACDPERGLPLVWKADDVLRRPESYRGAAFEGVFDVPAFARIAAEAHGRGMLLHAMLDPLPFGEGARERLASLRFVARQLADVRRLGRRAIDGLGLRRWLYDDRGYTRAMLQDFHPGAYLFRLGERAPAIASALGALDAEDGALRGFAADGLCDGWRDGFPPDLYPLGVLDARAVRPAPSRRGATRGGGSFGDWIVEQANDFVRRRRADGGAMWWRTFDRDLLGPLGIDYVHGISLDPLRAAVAMQLAATGSNGYRAAVAALEPKAPKGFAASLPSRAAVHVLQNNWFRIVGSGGGLLFDPRGEARFRPGQALVLSPSFLRTRLFGGRPDAGIVKTIDLDLLERGAAPAGGYGRVATIGGPVGSPTRMPAMLAFDAAPEWPQRAQVELSLESGYYELEIGPRAVRGRGVLVTRLDGIVIDCRPFRAGDRVEIQTVPVHVARAGLRQLELAVAEGGTVAIDHLRIVRRGDVAAEGGVDRAAGHYACLVERSASSYHEERVELCTIGDFPGFLVRMLCRRTSRNLRFERTIDLPAYTGLAAGGGERGRLRGPFVLRAADPSLPDLLVAPLRLGRYDHFRFGEGKLVLHSTPEQGTECHVGFWLLPHGRGEDAVPYAAAVFRGLDRPLELDISATGGATLVSDLPIPWTRVVRVFGRVDSPLMVRENGWWTWRGVQADADGGHWVRVCQLPGDAVELLGGPGVLARTRPGPGSLHVLALRDVEADAVLARVTQPSRLMPPSVVMGGDFDEVRVNGEPWAWFRDRRVFLPDRRGDYRIEVVAHGGTTPPHVASTRAPLRRCAYDPARRLLEFHCDVDPTLPAGQPFTAVLAGPRPTRIEGGEVVDEDSLPHTDANARARAEAGGVLIRFVPGSVTVHYED